MSIEPITKVLTFQAGMNLLILRLKILFHWDPRSAGGGGGHAPQNQPGADPFGGTLGSILGGVLGGGGGHHPPPSSQSSDPLGGLGSILGGVLGGGGGNSNQPSFQPSGGYGGYPSGGYNAQQNSGGSSDLLSGIGSAIGSSLFSSALDGLSKHGKDVRTHSSAGYH